MRFGEVPTVHETKTGQTAFNGNAHRDQSKSSRKNGCDM